MIRIAICDDNQLDIVKLEKSIRYCFLNFELDYTITTYSTGGLFSYEIQKKEFDIVFLDVFLGSSDGIEISKKLREINCNTIIIFMSSEKTEVFRSFDASPIAYLLKPLSYEVIYKTLEKALKKLKIEKGYKFSFHCSNGYYTLLTDDIIYFESNLRIVNVQTKTNRYRFYGKLAEIEKVLEDKNFVRCHQSYIVNMQYIQKIEKNCIYTITGETIQISRGKSQAVKEKMIEYIGSIL